MSSSPQSHHQRITKNQVANYVVPTSAKRAERLLKRFDLKVSDITGGARGRTMKKTEDDATPAGKRKTGGDRDVPESPPKRQSRGRVTLKREESALQSDDGSESPTKVGVRTKLPTRAEKVAKKEDTGRLSFLSRTWIHC